MAQAPDQPPQGGSLVVVRFEGGVARYMLDGEIFETPGDLTLTAGPTITLVR